jgi:predicted heme/steroid binding protein
MNSFIDAHKVEAIREIRTRISYYKSIITSTACPLERDHLEEVIIQEINILLKLMGEQSYNPSREVKEFSAQELSEFDGSRGKPAYAAVNGVVYDVSNEPSWGGASHFGLIAGKDLTAQFNSCHGMAAILSKLPRVGLLR